VFGMNVTWIGLLNLKFPRLIRVDENMQLAQ